MRFSGVSANSALKEQRMIAVSVIRRFIVVGIWEVDEFCILGLFPFSYGKVKGLFSDLQILYI